jgi:hypothetical protein
MALSLIKHIPSVLTLLSKLKNDTLRTAQTLGISHFYDNICAATDEGKYMSLLFTTFFGKHVRTMQLMN